jgi:Cep192 domain 4
VNPGLVQAVSIALFLIPGGAQDRADMARPLQPTSWVKITPEKIDFGSQATGVASQPKSATLTNISQANVTIRDVSVSGIDFAETDTCQGSLSPGANCTIQVTFKPAVTGPRLGTIIISDSEPSSPRFLVLTGTGE